MQALQSQGLSLPANRPPFQWNRLIVAVALITLAMTPGMLGELTRSLMMDAYYQVAVFVAATLALFYFSERYFNINVTQTLKNARSAQVPLAALLGATPGCGGAVVVVAAYSSGHVGFGAVVATLTATMGDAAFLLIATRPDAAVVLLPISLTVGILSGWLVDFLGLFNAPVAQGACAQPNRVGRLRKRDLAYVALALPGLVIGILQLTQSPLYDAITPDLFNAIGLTGVLLGIAIWVTSPVGAMTHAEDHPATRVAEETNFIVIWVIGAYLAYDYLVEFSGLDLRILFSSVAWALPLMGVVVGFVPGCGPQVLVTTLYLNGVVPFSTLIGNAISNDGDALFPAIALNPRIAIMATLISAVPALIVAYGFYFFAPGFMN